MSANQYWLIRNDRCDSAALDHFASGATVSNGYLGLTGTIAEKRDGPQPVTLINGIYDELDMFGLIRPSAEQRPYLDPRYFDTAGKSPAIANLPDPLFIRVFVGGRELSLWRGSILGFNQSFDLRTGLFSYRYDYRDSWGHTTRVEMQRFASLRHAHRVFMRYRLTRLDHDLPITVWSGIDAQVHANPTNERQFNVVEAWAQPAERCRLLVCTPARAHDVNLCVANVTMDGAGDRVSGRAEDQRVYTVFDLPPGAEQTWTLDRFVVLTSSEDLRHSVVADPERELDSAADTGFDQALLDQSEDWDRLWDRADVEISGDDRAQCYLRFCIHHLLAAAPRFSDRLSVPVKLLTGEYYQGNTFYDTETCILPFYTLVRPELARTCLDFRYEGLRPARETTHQLGYDGAKFPWQAGPHGEECLGRWYRFPQTNIHINADIAWAVRLYLDATGDQSWADSRGLDLLVETARFYASRAESDPNDDSCDLLNVTGPDEGHCGINTSFYTNYLARRNLQWAADACARLGRSAAARRRLNLRHDEPDRWRSIADRLKLLHDADTGRYEQFAGFYQLRPAPNDLLQDRRTWFMPVQTLQAIHQPDVLMAITLLPDEFPRPVQQANWDYYHGKGLNFSSISHGLNALLTARLGQPEAAYQGFITAAGMDLDPELTRRGDTHVGLHGTALGAAWMAAVLGFGGVSVTADAVRIDPQLPPGWQRLRFKILVRAVEIGVEVTPAAVTLTTAGRRGLPLPVTVRGRPVQLDDAGAVFITLD